MKNTFRAVNDADSVDIPAGIARSARYSRAVAIAEREIVPVPQGLANECRFRVPVAMTSSAWEECVEWAEAGTSEVVWDVLFAALGAIRSKTSKARSADFAVLRVATGQSEATPVSLRAEVEADDEGQPALTIYLASE